MSTFHRVLSTFRNILLILTASGLVYAQVPISGLPQATLPLSGNESVVMNQNGTTKQGKVSSITSLVTLSQATGITLTPNPIVGGAGTIGLTIPVAVTSGGTGALTLSGLVVGNGTGPFTGYAGATCTNQFLRSLSSTGSGTCNAVNLATDVTGNLSVNNLNSGTGASASTYWSGNGTWTAPAGGITGLANPSGLIGLTAANGVATTATRSDATHALDQSITPTWTGAHTFSFAGIGVDHNSSSPRERYFVTGATANQGVTLVIPSSAGIEYDSATDAAPTTAVSTLWKGTRTGAAWSSFTFGNATDNPSFTFAGTGAFSTTGDMSINVTAGVGLSVQTSLANTFASTISSSVVGGAGGQGLLVQAGGTSADIALAVRTRAGSPLFTVQGGGVLLAPALGTSSAATTGTLCWTTGTGLINVDTTTTCLASSIRFKKNVEDLNVGLKEVMALRPVSYELKPEYDPNHLGRQVGLIAEEVQKTDGRLVSLDHDGKTPRGVRYQQLTAVLIKAIQEQQAEIQELKSELQKVKRKGH